MDYTNTEAGTVAEQARAAAGEGGIDVCYDAVGGDNTAQGIAALKDGGHIVSIANFGVAKLAEAAGRGLTGVSFGPVQPSCEQLAEIAALVDGGEVRTPELQEMPLEACAAAHDLSESHRVKGKLVLRVAADPEPPAGAIGRSQKNRPRVKIDREALQKRLARAAPITHEPRRIRP